MVARRFPTLTSTTHQRPGADGDAMTTPACRPPEDEVWAAVLPCLWRYARSRGLSAEDAGDAAQEAARRALEKQVPYLDAEDLLRWCQTVVSNYSVDLHRRSRRSTSREDMQDAPDPIDRLAVIETRHLLEQVIARMKQLPDSQQDALVAHLVEEPAVGRKEQDRLAQARQRARRVLRREVGYPVPALVLMGGWLRRLLRGPVLPATSITLAGCVALVVTLDAPGPPRPSPARPDEVVVPAWGPNVPRSGIDRVHRPVARNVTTARQPRLPAPTATPIVAQGTPLGLEAGAEQRPATKQDHLLCLGGGPIETPVCLG